MAEIDFNALGNVIDTSWGRSSTPNTASYSVKMRLGGGNRVILSYQGIVHFSSQREYIMTKRLYAEESTSIVKEVIKNAKAAYKKYTGKSIKFNEVSRADSVEIINMNFYNPRRAAYYRVNMVFEVT